MFATLDLNSKSSRAEGVSKVEKPTKRRSKTGCLTCRKRKKKCDEARPVCVFCQKRGLSCEWEIKHYGLVEIKVKNEARMEDPRVMNPTDLIQLIQGQGGRLNEFDPGYNEKKPSDTEPYLREEIIEIPRNIEHDYTPGNAQSLTSFLEDELTDKTDNLDSQLALSRVQSPLPDFLNEFTLNEIFSNYTPMLVQPSSSFNLFLDDKGLVYLNYFESNVANLLSVSPRSSNYFLKTFFTLAVSNESILNALAAWGALFHSDANHEIVNKYLQRSKDYANKSLLNKYDYFVTLAYYLINIGIQVCSGDTKNWHTIFNKCCDLLGAYGGVRKFIKDFNYSNDCKFLLANFQFHDVMSSETLTNGTRCLLSNYNDIFQTKNSSGDEEYGIDPYQGCIQPIVLLLGEIMNCYAKVKSATTELNKELNSGEAKNIVQIHSRRLNHYEVIDQFHYELANKVRYCEPLKSQLDQLPTEEEKEKHLKLFELYRITSKMYLALYFKQLQPNSSEVQNLLLSSLKIIDELIETYMKGAFNMSLLICGISCCNEYDRMILDKKFQKIYSSYKVGNVKRIWHIVKESWRRNATGGVCIDWIDICNDFGWKLSLC
ncbi:uncharacterized protein CANTADRAFT_24308 [Suhomyces tanzawaensis NRRL Y-17324]|uniref:Zn(2)-C6 fungal-type domain-containing protein n=1 Tax=Suhomyces tanzawaensis NRRL Y-17324 TaxID=984487 RepID=A0A1E4SP60_9ASCO|nr:uncharacterized protein CANTADRAFT_24308 [Suhomyces tanzawaensis NRRL Y-17324]ODV81320.1 hypothetical protein CANTADRAFT_24308 [Suhomyces tanzawaensis NRRL Y-17324]